MRRFGTKLFGDGQTSANTANDTVSSIPLLPVTTRTTGETSLNSQSISSNDDQVEGLPGAAADMDCNTLNQFHKAVDDEDLNCLENMLTALPSDLSRAMLVNAKTKDGLAALHQAARKNHIRLAKLLIKCGGNVNVENNLGSTPLHLYVLFRTTNKRESSESSPDLEMIDLLVKAGANVNARTLAGATPLHAAVFAKDEAAVAYLLGLPDIEPNIADNDGWLPLHDVCKHYSPSIASLLLDTVLRRTDLNLIWHLKTDEGYSPLHIAVWNNHLQLVTRILTHEICTQANLVCVDNKTNGGDTALHYACQNGQYEICVQLLEHGGVKCLGTINDKGLHPLDIAVKKGHKDICKLIFEYQKQQDGPENVDFTPFTRACAYGSVELLRWIVENCRIELCSEQQNKLNFLSDAIKCNRRQVAKYVVQESPLWHNGLCNYLAEKKSENKPRIFNTPMRALIRKMPSVARQALNRCTDITATGARFNYEFVDDTFSTWEPEWVIWNADPSMRKKNDKRENVFSDLPYTADAGFLETNHVISHIIRHGRDDLLKHPLVSTLIEQKWKKLGRTFFLASFVSYALFLTLLTAFSLSIAPVNSLFYVNGTFHPIWKANDCNNFSLGQPFDANTNMSNEEDVCRVFEKHRSPFPNCSMHWTDIGASNRIYFTQYARWILFVWSICMLLTQLFVAVASFGTAVTGLDELRYWVYYLTMIIAFPFARDTDSFFCFYQLGLLQSWAWQVASINILLAYSHLALKLEYAPGIGIYMHTFRKVLATMLRALVAPFGVILGAFALSLYMIFKASLRHKHHVKQLVNDVHDHSELPLNPFYNVPKAILKTLIMFIGEFDVEAHFTNNDAIIASAVLSLVALFGTIALMNLLTSLAINDVGTLLDHAEVHQLKMQSRYTLRMEKLLRDCGLTQHSYFKNLVASQYISYYDWDGVLLQQTNEYTEALIPDESPITPKSNWIKSSIKRFLSWFYYTILVGKRYKPDFGARLQKIVDEKIKVEEEISKAREVAEKSDRAKNKNDVTLANLTQRVEALHSKMEAQETTLSTILMKMDEISRRPPATEPNGQK